MKIESKDIKLKFIPVNRHPDMELGVTLTHIPTGTIATCDRFISSLKNYAAAYRLLIYKVTGE